MKNTSFLKNFSKHKLALISAVLIFLEVLTVIFLPMLLKLNPVEIFPGEFNAAPSAAHWLGTDDVGRDLFARLVCGGRVSIFIGFAATVISVLIGIPLGLLAGYYRGWFETIVMRCADIFMAFPAMVLILVIVAVFESSITTITIVIGVLGWPGVAKLLYGNVLSIRNKEFVEAEKAIATSNWKILFHTVLPNSIAPLWVSLAFRISSAMITESGLSFLGAGVQPPQASWGNIIQSATSLAVLTQRWWIWIPAGSCLVLTIVCINFVGEGIRDALDPKMKRL